MTMWMPLALLGLHRALARGRLRDGLATGFAFALQTLSSLYYGCFLAVYLAVVGGALWLGRGRPRKPIAPLAAGVVLAAVLDRARRGRIHREPSDDGHARGRHDPVLQRNRTGLSEAALPAARCTAAGPMAGVPERALFPRLMPVALAAVALWPPLSAARIAYALGLVLAVDGSFGLNGATFTALHAVLSPFKGLRVPARFSLLAGMTLAILAGYGAARLLGRWPRQRGALTALIAGARDRRSGAVHAARAGMARASGNLRQHRGKQPPVVLAEFPMPRDIYQSDFDARYLYFSIVPLAEHRQRQQWLFSAVLY